MFIYQRYMAMLTRELPATPAPKASNKASYSIVDKGDRYSHAGNFALRKQPTCGTI
jgi:hypothetical protein